MHAKTALGGSDGCFTVVVMRMFLDLASGTMLEPFSSFTPSVWIHVIGFPTELKHARMISMARCA